MKYVDYQPQIGPPWLQRTFGAAWTRALGTMKDDQAARLLSAVQMRMPGIAPADALDYIGQERQLDRSTLDTDATYAERLRTAWDLWQWAGTAYGMLLQFRTAGYSNVAHVQANGVIHELDTDGNLVISYTSGTPPRFAFAVSNAFWSRFAIIFHSPLPSTWTNISGTPSSSTAPTDTDVNSLRSIVRRWKRAAASCSGIYVLQAGRLWGYPAMTWAQSAAHYTWGGNRSVRWSV